MEDWDKQRIAKNARARMYYQKTKAEICEKAKVKRDEKKKALYESDKNRPQKFSDYEREQNKLKVIADKERKEELAAYRAKPVWRPKAPGG